MKELSIEEKARAYDEALERAKKVNKCEADDREPGTSICEYIFPELYESSDERIRKALIDGFTVMKESKNCGKTFSNHNIPVADILAWLEKQGDKCLVNFDEAEKEKYDFVSEQYIECRASFNEFKEGNSYWLEYVGDDTYIGRSDNILNQKFHITPRQLYRLFTQQHFYKEDNTNDETNAPTEYGKYVDKCLNEASKHFFSEGEDAYSVADLFYAGVRCGKSWLEKQGESSDQIHFWTEEEIEPIISDYLRGAEHYGGMIGRLRCLKPKSLEKQGTSYTKSDVDDAYLKGLSDAKNELEKQGNSPIKWNKNTEGNKPQVNHSVLMKTTHSIAEGEWKGEYWEQYRLAGIVRDSDVLSWMELSDLDKQGDANKEYWRGYREGKQEILDKYAELEKQGEEEQLYIRFGEIPTDEKSKIYRGEIEVGTENGVSVYPAFKTNEGDIVLGLNLPITKTTLYTQQHLIEYDDRPCYLVKGDYVGKDTDGQTLINNVSIIEKIDTYRLKEKKQGEQKPTLRERYKNIAESEWFKKTHEGMSVSDDEKVDNVNKIEQKPVWSEEDEKITNDIKESLLAYKIIVMDNDMELANYIEKEINWLKSLKERIGE